MGFHKLFSPYETNPNLPNIEIYADGSIIGNGRQDALCGWAYAIVQDGNIVRSHSGCCVGGTNNTMEMTAVAESLRYLEPSYNITVYSDSKYVIETLNGNFRVKANVELWRDLHSIVSRFPHIQFKWVKGHADNTYNNYVDEKARQAAQSLKTTCFN